MLWLVGPGRAWPYDTQAWRTQSGPGGLRLPLPEGYQANYKLLTKKKSNTWPFVWGGKKGGSGESELSDLFRCKQFCSAFSFEFSFVILAKFCHSWHNHYYFYLFKIRSQYTRFSLFFFSLIDYVQKCKEVNLYRLSPPDSHALPLLLAVANASKNKKQKQTKQTKVIKYAALFSNMAQFPGRVQISKQYFLFEMDTVENNIFTLNI